ncbi:MAG: hypothetical protein ACLFRP_02035 [Puniceicoccaceae bacterium]
MKILFGSLVFALALPFVMSGLRGEVERGPRPEPLKGGEKERELFWKGLELHQEGVAGDEKAVVRAQEIFEALQAEHPEDARVLVFLGNLYTLRARDAVFYRKMGWLEKGLETIDRAVALEPEDPHVRSVRAVNSYRLPRLFGRRDVAGEDFAVLLEWAEEDPERFSPDLLRFVYFHAGRYEARSDRARARELYELALAVPAESVSESEIRKALEEV